MCAIFVVNALIYYGNHYVLAHLHYLLFKVTGVPAGYEELFSVGG